MTAPVDEPVESSRAPAPVAEPDELDRPFVDDLCPYLVSKSGSWRSATANRSHRCAAVDPPGFLTTDKQRRLCLTADHAHCVMFRAARASRAAMLAPGLDPAVVAAADAARRPIGRTTAIVLEHPRLSAPVARWPIDRAISQVALVGLMILAFAAVAVARMSAPAGETALASPTAIASPTASPTPRPTPRPTPSPSASAPPSPSAAAATPQPSFRTYKVKKGDTLIGIAATFRTTVRAIQDLNGMKGSGLKIGQVLKIP
jgi:LysM repeat protein